VGFLDSLTPRYKPSPVSIDGVIGLWSAGRTFGGLSASGGQIALTRRHLVFSPWDMDQTRQWLFGLLGKTGAPDLVGKIDDFIAKTKLLEPVAIPRADIGNAQVLNWASLFKPPNARLSLRDGRHIDFGILASPTTPNFSKTNNEALEHFLSTLELPST
jgi:hypothetical protein